MTNSLAVRVMPAALLALAACASQPAPTPAPAAPPPRPSANPVVTDASAPYFEFQVEKPARLVIGGALKYPDLLRSANVEGQVLVQFVVDTTGRYEPGTFRVLKSQHELFTQAVRAAMPAMMFSPAEIGGRKVRQLVQQPFTFSPPRGQE